MKDIIIINDILNGSMGERVFWNYMLEGIPNIHGIELTKIHNPNKYIDDNFSLDSIIIQNATFIPKIDNKRTTISFLQDNLRKMNKRSLQQEQNLISSTHIVFNSKETAKYYEEYSGDIIPIGIDTDLFSIKNKNILRQKYSIPNKKTGIFVGNFTDTKGWKEVQSIIDKYSDINFILVSKNKETYIRNNTFCFYKISQEVLSELLNCADFFILGSPVETQCLGALEAGFCGLPIAMKTTGIFMDWEDREYLGCFNQNLEHSMLSILDKKFFTRDYLMQKDLSIVSMIDKWINLLRKYDAY